MKPLKLLLVSLHEHWRRSLLDSLSDSGYIYETREVTNKKEALSACNQSKFDVLITSSYLSDGSSEDLVKVLSGSMASMIVTCNHTPKKWISLIRGTLEASKLQVEEQTRQKIQQQRIRYAESLRRCSRELQFASGNVIEGTLKNVLEVMEVSRVYVQVTPFGKNGPLYYTHEVTEPGYFPNSGESGYEVSVQQLDNRLLHLGIEDISPQRQWNKSEIHFIQSMAHLLKGKLSISLSASNLMPRIRISA